jgi:hypothetical protein
MHSKTYLGFVKRGYDLGNTLRTASRIAEGVTNFASLPIKVITSRDTSGFVAKIGKQSCASFATRGFIAALFSFLFAFGSAVMVVSVGVAVAVVVVVVVVVVVAAVVAEFVFVVLVVVAGVVAVAFVEFIFVVLLFAVVAVVAVEVVGNNFGEGVRGSVFEVETGIGMEGAVVAVRGASVNATLSLTATLSFSGTPLCAELAVGTASVRCFSCATTWEA